MPQRHPLLVAGQSGDGRVLAFAGDSTWRWQMGGFGEAHRRFWRQGVLWLAKKDEQTEGRVWIRAGRPARDARHARRFHVGAENAQGEPIDTAQFEVAVQTPDGTQRVDVRPTKSRRRIGPPRFARRRSRATIGSWSKRRTAAPIWAQRRRGSWCRIRIWNSIGRRPSRRSWPNWPR